MSAHNSLNFKQLENWHAACFTSGMRSEIFAMLMPDGSPAATLVVRRSDGGFAFERIDARVAAAVRVAAGWFREESAGREDSAEWDPCALVASH